VRLRGHPHAPGSLPEPQPFVTRCGAVAGNRAAAGHCPCRRAFLALTLLAWFVLGKTRFGRHLALIGANRDTGAAAGVPWAGRR